MNDAADTRFDSLIEAGDEHAINYFLYHNPETLLDLRGDAVVEHFVMRVRGPSLMAADALTRVLSRTGPCPPLEEVVATWIRDGRFDGAIDAPDRSTSVQFLAGILENPVAAGRFDRRWWLIDVALAHWRDLLSDSGRHLDGLDNMLTLLDFRRDLCGRLPDGVLAALPPGSPAHKAVKTGFDALKLKKQLPDSRSADDRLAHASGWLYATIYGEL